MYRKCELDISCTFFVPIIHTVQVIQPVVQEMSYILYIFCMNPLCSTSHKPRNISCCAEIVIYSVVTGLIPCCIVNVLFIIALVIPFYDVIGVVHVTYLVWHCRHTCHVVVENGALFVERVKRCS